jgi:ubiquinone/menaquinone biosynthesis C-methylase UbiE
MARDSCWNHNVHYQPVILRAVPPRCGPALDVGCGDGMLACRLAERCTEVTGIDRDTRMIAQARERAQAHRGRINFAEADFLTYPAAEASFDFVCANTSLHHMDFATALSKMARLLRPGGRLAVIGLANNGSLADFVPEVPAAPVNLFYRAVCHEGSSGAPVKDPDMTWGQVRATASTLLPGVRYRRHLLWRYSLLWSKPSPTHRRRPGCPP